MSQALWSARPAPLRACAAPIGWTGTPGSAAELSLLRLRLRNALLAAAAWVDEDALERLLLVFEELASNGLRHGRGPVQVVVRTTSGGWLLEVSDAAADRPPVPAVGRDAAEGGLGLYMAARLSAAHGWTASAGRKTVWALVRHGAAVAPSSDRLMREPAGR